MALECKIDNIGMWFRPLTEEEKKALYAGEGEVYDRLMTESNNRHERRFWNADSKPESREKRGEQ